jgi:hypothetical protein
MPYIVLDDTLAELPPAVTIGAPLTSVGMTLSDFQTELYPELGSRGDVLQTSARMTLWINWAMRNVSSMVTLKELFGSFALATVADQPFYALPIQVAWLKRVSVIDDVNFLSGGRELEMTDESGYRLLSDVTNGDEPTQYFRYRRMIVLWATPDAVYNLAIDCRVRPDDLVDATDSPLLPAEFHESILLYARYRAFRSLRLYSEASAALNDATTTLRPLLNTDAEEMDGAIQQVQPIRRKSQLFQGRS